MKKLLFLLFAVALFIACDKDKDDVNVSLQGTTWGTTFQHIHSENGKDYPHTREVEVNFNSETRGTFLLKAVNLPDDITLEAFPMNFSYTYNGSSGTATFEPNGEKVPFTVTGNKLKMTVELQPGIDVAFELTKK